MTAALTTRVMADVANIPNIFRWMIGASAGAEMRRNARDFYPPI
jgi:hypothetical protein